MNGFSMLRLTLLLCFGMYAALMIAGKDRGQLRPGLAEAAAQQALEAAIPDLAADSKPAEPEPITVVTAAAAVPVAVSPKPAVTPVVAAVAPKPYVEPARTVVTEVQEPVFSLAAAGTETVPVAPDPQPAPEVADGGDGTIWYVNADSVNVRAAPSTDAEVLGRLGNGEATLLVQSVDNDWARIVIQGDGVEGFVAKRYLSPVAP